MLLGGINNTDKSFEFIKRTNKSMENNTYQSTGQDPAADRCEGSHGLSLIKNQVQVTRNFKA